MIKNKQLKTLFNRQSPLNHTIRKTQITSGNDERFDGGRGNGMGLEYKENMYGFIDLSIILLNIK